MKIRLVITGRNYPLSQQLPAELSLSDSATVHDALQALQHQLQETAPLPGSCLVTVSGEHLGTLANYRSRRLAEGEELVLIAPMAGG